MALNVGERDGASAGSGAPSPRRHHDRGERLTLADVRSSHRADAITASGHERIAHRDPWTPVAPMPAAAAANVATDVLAPAEEAAVDAASIAPSPSPRMAIGVTVVIPARNEADNIGWVLRRLPDFIDEVVIVDGNSTDRTVEVARSVRPDVVVVNDNGRGKGDAMRVGAQAARGEYVVMIDADGSMDPAEIERYIDPLADGFDFVKGSRFLDGGGTTDMTTLRKVGHFGLLVLSNTMYRSKWTDLCYGFCAFRQSALRDLELDADGFEIETQMVVRASRIGLRVTEVPSFEYPRRSGHSQLNTFRDGWRVLCTIFQERVRRHAKRVDDQRVARNASDV